MITWGTNPGMVAPLSGRIPASGDEVFRKALAYMGFEPGKPARPARKWTWSSWAAAPMAG
jgi:hypothetical protein